MIKRNTAHIHKGAITNGKQCMSMLSNKYGTKSISNSRYKSMEYVLYPKCYYNRYEIKPVSKRLL